MKPTLICLALASAFLPLTVSADTCSAVKSGKSGKTYNCSQIAVAPQGNLAGVQPPQTAPVHIGALLDDHHNVVLMPAAVPQAAVPNLMPTPMNVPDAKAPGQVPTPQQAAVPNLVEQKTPPLKFVRRDTSGAPPDFLARNTYFLTRNGVTTRLTGQEVHRLFNSHYIDQNGVLSPQSIANGFSVIDQRAPNLAPSPMSIPGTKAPGQVPTQQQAAVPNLVPTPMNVPDAKAPGQVPPQQQAAAPNLVPTPMNVPDAKAPGQVPTQQQAAAPNLVQGSTVLVPHRSDIPKPVTSGRVATDGVYSLEFIEPGLQSRKVKVYRSNDVAEQVYKDTIPLDQGGFQVIVVGTRNPEYIH